MLGNQEYNLIIAECSDNTVEVSSDLFISFLGDTSNASIFEHNLYQVFIDISQCGISKIKSDFIDILRSIASKFGVQINLFCTSSKGILVYPLSKIYIENHKILLLGNSLEILACNVRGWQLEYKNENHDKLVGLLSDLKLKDFIFSDFYIRALTDWINVNDPQFIVQPFSGALNWISSKGEIDIYFILWAYLFQKNNGAEFIDALNGVYHVRQEGCLTYIKRQANVNMMPLICYKTLSEFKKRIQQA